MPIQFWQALIHAAQVAAVAAAEKEDLEKAHYNFMFLIPVGLHCWMHLFKYCLYVMFHKIILMRLLL